VALIRAEYSIARTCVLAIVDGCQPMGAGAVQGKIIANVSVPSHEFSSHSVSVKEKCWS
jgi:hypothetical protein